METVLAVLFSVFVFVAIIAFRKWHKYEKDQKLRKLISWSATGDYDPVLGQYSYVRELLFTLLNAQYDDAIDKKHRITEEERRDVIEIIEEYQKNIMRSYFKGRNIVIKSKYVVTGEDYFMFALYAFLSDHQSTYTLTDTEVVFHKMHYITYMYCKRNDILRDLIPAWNERVLKKTLDDTIT